VSGNCGKLNNYGHSYCKDDVREQLVLGKWFWTTDVKFFHSEFWHCWLGERKVIWSIQIWAAYTQPFWCGTHAETQNKEGPAKSHLSGKRLLTWRISSWPDN